MKTFQFHPFAEEYPMVSPAELGRIEQAMRERGFDRHFPLTLYRGKILDGRTRYTAAQNAGLKCAIPTVTFKGTEEEAKQFVITANEDRRHLTPDWLSEKRAGRIARVAEARQQGQSLRTIAENEDVSVAQVQADLEKASTVQGGCTAAISRCWNCVNSSASAFSSVLPTTARWRHEAFFCCTSV